MCDTKQATRGHHLDAIQILQHIFGIHPSIHLRCECSLERKDEAKLCCVDCLLEMLQNYRPWGGLPFSTLVSLGCCS